MQIGSGIVKKWTVIYNSLGFLGHPTSISVALYLYHSLYHWLNFQNFARVHVYTITILYTCTNYTIVYMNMVVVTKFGDTRVS